MLRYFIFAVALILISGCNEKKEDQGSEKGKQVGAAQHPEKIRILALNDLYKAEGIRLNNTGGLARVRTLRAELEKEHGPVLVLHAGDLFNPSLPSRVTKGLHMVKGLNMLDGSAGTMDPYMFATFGNHEFDNSKNRDLRNLNENLHESEFKWLASNIIFEHDDNGYVVASPNLQNMTIVEMNGVKLGVYGIITPVTAEYIEGTTDIVATSQRAVRHLKSAGADIVVALSHLTVEDDRKLLSVMTTQLRPDLVIGGHDHRLMSVTENGRRICKSAPDARVVHEVIISVDENKGAKGVECVEHSLDSSVTEDPAVKAVVEALISDAEAKYCTKLNKDNPPRCLDEAYGSTASDLEGEEEQIRAGETSLGNWVTDLMRSAQYPDGVRPDIALMNSGSLRLNYNIEASVRTPSEIERRVVEETIGFPTIVRLITISAETLKQALRHSAMNREEGAWLQVSGVRFDYDNASCNEASRNNQDFKLDDCKIRNINILAKEGQWKNLDSINEPLLVATTNYLIEPLEAQACEIENGALKDQGKCQDGYTMFDYKKQLNEPKGYSPHEVKVLMKNSLKKNSPIQPSRDGRVCEVLDTSCIGLR